MTYHIGISGPRGPVSVPRFTCDGEGCGLVHHPATRGWLLAWLQRDAVAVQVNGHDVWCEWVDGASTRHNHYTGDDALAAALLAAWGAP